MHAPRRLAALLALTLACLVPLTAQEPVEPRVILISIDGLMPVGYTGPGDSAPNLRALARQGVWAEGVVGVTPTVTYPSHTTLITGVRPAVHGIVDNRIFDPEDRSGGAWYYFTRNIRVPTLPTAARARGLRTAAINWPVTVGMELDYLIPEYFRFSHPENLSMLRALSTPRTLLEAVEFTRGKPFAWPLSDRDRTDMALFVLRNFDPHVMLLHLVELDSAQHGFGPGSAEATETLGRVDALVGEIVAAVKASSVGARTNIAIVSDHGFLAVKTLLQPNALFKREGLLKVGAGGRVTDWQAYYHASGGSGYVYLKDPALAGRVGALLDTLKQDPANGIRAVWTRADLDVRGAHPSAAFGLDMADSFYSGEGHDVLVKPSATKGGHGFDPERQALHSAFIIAGPDVPAHGGLGVIQMTRIAPTLASILKVQLSPLAAAPLETAVKARP